MDDIQNLNSKKGGFSSLGKVATVKKSPSPITPSRKSPRDLGQKQAEKAVEGSSDDEEDLESEEVVKEMQEEIKIDGGRKKRKREILEDVHSHYEETFALPLSPVHLHLEDQNEEKAGYAEGEVQTNDRRKAWINFNVKIAKMRIFREAINPQILVDNQEEQRLEELIDPTIVAILNKARETGMNLLNNARNNMIDNFRSIKWLFHELKEVKDQVKHIEATREGKDANRRTDSANRLTMAEQRIHNLENYNHNLAN